MKKNIEILAPAGSYEAMKAAMNAGADAVYMGGSSFGARAYAVNTHEVILRAIDEAHIRNKRLYLTVNTLVKEYELVDKLYDFLHRFYLQGLDGVIVQDVGVMRFIHRNFPGLPIHASTQATIIMAQGGEVLENTGVTRLVTARELSLDEIRLISDNTNLEIETFVHGALCYCYSGQCLMSSMIGGRSGNRGRCAQPCRMPYGFLKGNNKNRYLLSPKDINTISIIPELIDAGIDSFKIEGRMKSPHYSALVSAIYKKYTDYYINNGSEKYTELINSREYEKDLSNLLDVYNRGGFSEGYAKTYHGRQMMSLSRPNHSGVFIGKVSKLDKAQAHIKLYKDINSQDVLEIRDDNDKEIYEFTIKGDKKKDTIILANLGSKKDKVHIGQEVYRTKNNVLLNQIEDNYLKQDKEIGINGLLTVKEGERLKLELRCYSITITAFHNKVEHALNQPMTDERLSKPIKKTGNTMFYFNELTIEKGKNVFVPVIWLNEIRRNAFRLLYEGIIDKYRRTLDVNLEGTREIGVYNKNNDINSGLIDKTSNKNINLNVLKEDIKNLPYSYGICIMVQNMEQFRAGMLFDRITSIYGVYDTLTIDEILIMAETSKKDEKNFYLVLPRICRPSVYEKLERDIFNIVEKTYIKGFVVNNFEEISLLGPLISKSPDRYDIVLNYNMYIFNSETKKFYNDIKIHHFTASVELNQRELEELNISDSDIVVYGRLPLMVSVQCLYDNTQGCKRCKSDEIRKDYLVDRLGKKFYVQTMCNSCYNTILNGQCLSLLKQSVEVKRLNPINIRLDFTIETKDEVNNVLSCFIDMYCNGFINNHYFTEYTTGHFRRGVE